MSKSPEMAADLRWRCPLLLPAFCGVLGRTTRPSIMENVNRRHVNSINLQKILIAITVKNQQNAKIKEYLNLEK